MNEPNQKAAILVRDSFGDFMIFRRLKQINGKLLIQTPTKDASIALGNDCNRVNYRRCP